jgi:hypothetical protein
MALLPNINVGTSPNDGTGSSLRDAFIIVNENFQLIEAFFPNSSVANLAANIESTGTSVFNIANVDVLNVNTISSYTTTDITATNITVDVLSANTITGFTVSGNITANIESTGESTFNLATFSGNSTFTANLIADTTIANIANLDIINATNVVASANITAGNLNILETTSVTSLTISQDAVVTGNVSSGGTFSTISTQSGLLVVPGTFKANGRFSANTHTITSDANLAASPIYAQTIVANLTAGNITITLPNASVPYSKGIWYTFICYDEGGLDNRTLTINVQPSAGNIWTSANTQNTFVNVGAELGTNSVNLKTNEIYWFTS